MCTRVPITGLRTPVMARTMATKFRVIEKVRLHLIVNIPVGDRPILVVMAKIPAPIPDLIVYLLQIVREDVLLVDSLGKHRLQAARRIFGSASSRSKFSWLPSIKSVVNGHSREYPLLQIPS